MASLDREQRRQYGRLGGLTTFSLGKTNTGPAFQARWAGYLARVDEQAASAGQAPLEDLERTRRAQALMRADMIRLSRAAVAARAAKRQARIDAARRTAAELMR